jgi:8-oxo-dGTP pyrophosphatase MutT (NUDIX family)
MSEKNPWKKLSSKVVYSNPWITVREDQVVCPDGSAGIYGVVEASVATGVVALTKNREVYLVGQYRYTTDMYCWEIIEGGSKPGEVPLDAAKRELREEAGLEAKKWRTLGGELQLSNSHSSEKALLFIAEDFNEVPRAPDSTEVLQVKKVPFAECVRMVTSGEIADSLTVMGILLAKELLS